MSATAVVIIVAVIVVAAVLAGLVTAQRRRRLQRRFGPEYDILVGQRNSRLRAEAELSQRVRRVRRLHLRPLNDEARARYSAQWAGLQEEFVDRPADAVAASRLLVMAAIKELGYPTGDRDQLLADLSVDHSSALEHYRAAEQVSQSGTAGSASTEDQRQALIHYRSAFQDLLGEPDNVPAPAASPGLVVDAEADEQIARRQDDLVPADEPLADAGKPEPTEAADESPEGADAAEAADADTTMHGTPRS